MALITSSPPYKYTSLLTFPSPQSVGNGALGIALNTSLLYISTGSVWTQVGTTYTLGNLSGSGTAGISVTGGTGAVIGSGTSISQTAASGSTNGYLSSTDWTTFNSKQNSLTFGNLTETTSSVLTITGGTGSVIGSGTTIQVAQSGAGSSGYLSSTDWNTFNNKQSSITFGTVTETTSSVLTLSGWTNATQGSPTITVKQSGAAQSGYLSSTDWNTFNGKQNSLTFGNLTETGSSILTITGGTGAIIGSGTTIQVGQASTSTSGFLSSTDWNTFNNKLSSITTGNLTETGSSVLTITGGTGAVIGSGTTVQVASAGAAQAGIVTTGTQTMAGAKTFSTSVTSPAFISNTANPASAGSIRLANNESIAWRNNTNSTDYAIHLNSANNFLFDSSVHPSGNHSLGSATAIWNTAHVYNFQMYGTVSGYILHNIPSTTTSYSLTWPSAQSSGTKFLKNDGAGNLSWDVAGTGTVTSISVASSNGLAGTSDGNAATPTLTLSTSVNGMVKGNGTAFSAATSGTDYSAGTSALATGILKSTTTTGALSIAVAGDFPTLNQNTTGSAASVTFSVTAGENLSARDAVYISSSSDTGGRTTGRAYKLDATNSVRMEFVGFATAAATAGNAVTIQTAGILSGFTSLSAGTPIFASVATPGSYQTSAPSTVGQWIIQIGEVISSTDVLINDSGSATATYITQSGGFSNTVTSVTAAYTVQTTDYDLKVDMSGSSNASYAITLPTAVGKTGMEFNFVITAGTGVLSLNTTSSQTIGGFASGTIQLQYVNSSIRVYSDGSNWQYTNFKRPSTMTIKTSGTSATYNVPAGASALKVTVVGGGASGGGGTTGNVTGAGGGAGGTCIKMFQVGTTTSGTYTVGAAVSGVAGGTSAGTAGNNSSFIFNGVTLTANGGSAPVDVHGASGGTASGGDLNIKGGAGGPGCSVNAATWIPAGNGGASTMGGGGYGAVQNSGTQTGETAGNYGGGGGGGSANGSAQGGSGGGAAGVILIEEYY